MFVSMLYNHIKARIPSVIKSYNDPIRFTRIILIHYLHYPLSPLFPVPIYNHLHPSQSSFNPISVLTGARVVEDFNLSKEEVERVRKIRN